MSSHPEPPVNVTVQNKGCLEGCLGSLTGGLGCGGLLAVLLVVGLVTAYPMAALGLVALVIVGVGAFFYSDEAYRDLGRNLVRVGAAVGLLAAIGAIVLPLGPDVSVDQIRASLAEVVDQKEGPGRDKLYVSCDRSAFSSKTWDCHVQEVLPYLPDPDSQYTVTVADDGCWNAEGTDLSARGKRLTGCVDL